MIQVCQDTDSRVESAREFPIPNTITIYVRFNVAYGAPAPREGVQPEEGGTLQGWGYIRVLPARGYRH